MSRMRSGSRSERTSNRKRAVRPTRGSFSGTSSTLIGKEGSHFVRHGVSCRTVFWSPTGACPRPLTDEEMSASNVNQASIDNVFCFLTCLLQFSRIVRLFKTMENRPRIEDRRLSIDSEDVRSFQFH